MIKLDNVVMTEVTQSFQEQVELILKELLLGSYGARQEKIRHWTTPLGVDRTLTRLKRLKYKKFSCLKAPDGEIYLCGETKDMIFTIDDRDLNVGTYFVCISSRSIIKRQMRPIHMFPARDPRTFHRHLHHKVRNNPTGHPLMADESTCWGNVGPSYVSARNDGDVADMFRVLYIYLSRLNWSSPLDHQWQYDVNNYGEPV